MRITRSRPARFTVVAIASVLLIGAAPAVSVDITEGFEVVPPAGWTINNQSEPLGVTSWFQGNPAVFPAHQGPTNSYAGANFNSTTGTGTISTWLISPQITTLSNGDGWSFYTRTGTGSPFPDRLQLRMSTNGVCSPGTGAASTGDFATELVTVNPSLTVGGYPETYTQFSGTLSGITGQATGCLAFRYWVTDGGPDGANSNYIGVDTFAFTDDAPDVSIGDVTVAEGNAGTSNANFTVTLTPASASTVTVNYATANGTATAPGDYQTTSGMVTFAPADTSETVSVPVVGDTAVEPNETFLVNLSTPVNAAIGDGQGQGTITNDDAAAAQPKNVSLKANKKRVPKGKKVKLTAVVSPCPGHQGHVINLMKGASQLQSKASDTACTAVFTVKMKRKTSFTAVSPQQDADHLAGTSNKVTVKIRRT
jgi:Calx-beta domain